MNKWLAVLIISVLAVLAVACGWNGAANGSALEADLAAAEARIATLESALSAAGIAVPAPTQEADDPTVAAATASTQEADDPTVAAAQIATLEADLAAAEARIAALEAALSAAGIPAPTQETGPVR